MKKNITFEEFDMVGRDAALRSLRGNARDCILTTLINVDEDPELLEHPHRRMLDLAVICVIPAPYDPQTTVYAQVTGEIMTQLGLTEKELFALADDNTDEMLRPCLKPGQLDSGEFGHGLSGVITAVEMSNALSKNGATTGFKHWALRKSAEILDSGALLVMPVSRDRMLAFAERDIPADVLRDALVSNNAAIRAHRSLSEHIYRYDAYRGALGILL